MRYFNLRLLLALIAATAFGLAAFGNKRPRGFDPANMCTTTCKACDDFYQYANGGWIARTKFRRPFRRGASPARCVKRTSPRFMKFSKPRPKTPRRPKAATNKRLASFTPVAWMNRKLRPSAPSRSIRNSPSLTI